jgi:hypothetical protein
MDTKTCADGSVLMRIPPACEFPDCPPVVCNGDVLQCSDGTFVNRVPPSCAFEDCPAIVACTQDVFECPDGTFVSRKPPSCAFAPCPPSQQGYFTLRAAAGGCIARQVKGSGGDGLYLKSCSSNDSDIQWKLDSMGRVRSKSDYDDCMQASQYPALSLGVSALVPGTPMYAKNCTGNAKAPFQKMTVPAGFGQPGTSIQGHIRLTSRPELCVTHFAAQPTIGESRMILKECDSLASNRGMGFMAENPCVHAPFCQ